MVPPKYELIMVLSNYLFFEYCHKNIGLFSIAPCKVIALNLLCFIFDIISLLLYFISLTYSYSIAIPTIALPIIALPTIALQTIALPTSAPPRS